MKTSLKIWQEAERLTLLIALLLVLATSILTYRAWSAFERDIQDALITRRVADGTTALLASLTEAETGQRGFLLTGSDHYLEPYRQALKRIPASLADLARIEASRRNAYQLQRIETLQPLVREKMDELAEGDRASPKPGVRPGSPHGPQRPRESGDGSDSGHLR